MSFFLNCLSMKKFEDLNFMRPLNAQEIEDTKGGGILVGMAIAYLIGVGVGAGIRYIASSQK